jgi:galactokinase
MDVEEVSRAMSEALRRTMVSEEFKQRFGQTPTLWAQAPGRLDLMGSHTDYNECYVITMAIDRNTWMAARPRSDRKVLVRSLNMEGGGEFDLNDITHDTDSPWTDYIRGVAAVFQDEGYTLHGFDGLIHSTIPFGSGLSSSAAIEVVTATTLKMLAGNWEIEPVRLALLCQRAENEFVGMNCGVLDQYSSALGQTGHALLLDCRNLTARTATLHDDMRVVICDTRAERELTGSEYGERREQCEEGARRLADFYPAVTHLRDLTLEQFIAHEADLTEVVAKRCRFIIEENQRVLDLADALSADDRAAILALTEVSYAGAHDLFGIGAPSMEAMMKAMRSGPGVVGARQTGAGFGGCMVAFVEAHAVDAFAQYVSTRYRAETAIEPEVYPVRAAVGAGPLDFSGKT